MNDEITKNCEYLLYILRAPHPLRMEIFENAPKYILTTFVEVVLNILYGEINLDDAQKEELKKYKSQCLLIAKNIKSVQRKRSAILSTDPELFKIFASILGNYVQTHVFGE